MEIRFKRIIEQLERKKNTHPYLAQLWQSYMEIKKEKLLQYCLAAKRLSNGWEMNQIFPQIM